MTKKMKVLGIATAAVLAISSTAVFAADAGRIGKAKGNIETKLGSMSIKQTEKSEKILTHKDRLFLIWGKTVVVRVRSDRIIKPIYISKKAQVKFAQ